MKTIHKYHLPEHSFIIETHEGAVPLSVQIQDTIPCLWMEVDTKKPKIIKNYLIIGTGQRVPDGKYLGTVQTGPYVWHVYELKD